MAQVNGIDVSAFQPNINWTTVAASGIEYAIIKLTESTKYENNLDHDQSVKAKAAGLKIGYYHFAHCHVTSHSATDEANFFVSVIRKNSIPTADIIPALDAEQFFLNGVEQKIPASVSLESWIKEFCSVMAQNGFPTVMLYSNPSFLNQYLKPNHSLGNMPLWLSEYNSSLTVLPRGWTEVAIWQNSGAGHVNGYSGQIDTDVCADLSPILLNQPNA